jgi:queuine tRNA-ribosyltransferase
MGRNGTAFSSTGRLNIGDGLPDRGVPWTSRAIAACARFLAGLPPHRVSDEILGLRLLSLHNVHFLVSLMRGARAAIQSGNFESWASEWLDRLASGPESEKK